MAVKNRDVTWIKENINSSVRAIPNIHFVATTDLNGKVISQSGDVPEFTDKLSNPAIVDKLKNK